MWSMCDLINNTPTTHIWARGGKGLQLPRATRSSKKNPKFRPLNVIVLYFRAQILESPNILAVSRVFATARKTAQKPEKTPLVGHKSSTHKCVKC